MNLLNSKTKRAVSLYNSGFNCAQSVLAVFCEDYNINIDTALKLSSGLGGGFRCGEICGAVSGAVLTIGLKYGQNDADDEVSKAECNNKTVEFINLFREKHGSIACRELLRHDISIKEEYAEAQNKNLFKTTCVETVKSAVTLLCQLDY